MKKIYYAILMFLAIIAFCVSSILITKKTCKSIQQLANLEKQSIMEENFESAKINQIELENFWEKNKDRVELFTKAENLNDIDQLIKPTADQIKLKNKKGIVKNLNLICRICDEISKEVEPSFFNIF